MSELPYTPESPKPSGRKSATQAVNSFVFINHSLVKVQKVEIHAAQGTIWATPNGGALRVPAGKTVRWEAKQPFTVSFVQLGGLQQPLGPLSAERDRKRRVYFAEALMRSASEDAAPFYEYTVKMGDLTLDPIVIVDKH